jgi:hypothetical protein
VVFFQIPDLWKHIILPKLPPEITSQEKDNLKGIIQRHKITLQQTTNSKDTTYTGPPRLRYLFRVVQTQTTTTYCRILPTQGFFQGFFRAVNRPQKLNLELSFETQSSHQSFSAVKMKLFELNS